MLSLLSPASAEKNAVVLIIFSFGPALMVWGSRGGISRKHALICAVLAAIAGLVAVVASSGIQPGSGFFGLLLGVVWIFAALLALAFLSATLAIAFFLRRGINSRRRLPVAPKDVNERNSFRVFVAMLTCTLLALPTVVYWMATGSAENILRVVRIVDWRTPAVLTFAGEPRLFALQLAIATLIGLLSMIGTVYMYLSLRRRNLI